MVTMMNSDPYTVGRIQLRAPALSSSDYAFIQEHMQSGELFPEVSDPTRRAQITARLLSIEEVIPSLWTLISDIRYLRQPAKVLNILLPPTPRRGKNKRNSTLRERLSCHFAYTESIGGTMEIQTNTTSYTAILSSNLDSFELSYQQLWLCSYRVSKNLNAYGLLQLATLAHHLGFSSLEIKRALEQDPTCDIIQKAVVDALKVLRPNEAFIFDVNQANPIITSLKDYLSKILDAPTKSGSPFITVAGTEEPLNRRCGYGCMDTQDLNHLFLGTIHAPLHQYQKGGDEISSFYVKRSRHIAFFRALNLTGDRHSDLSINIPAPSTSTEQTIQIPRPVGETTSPMSFYEEQNRSPESSFQIMNQTSPSGRQVARFIQNAAPQVSEREGEELQEWQGWQEQERLVQERLEQEWLTDMLEV